MTTYRITDKDGHVVHMSNDFEHASRRLDRVSEAQPGNAPWTLSKLEWTPVSVKRQP